MIIRKGALNLRKPKIILDNDNTVTYTTPSYITITAYNNDGIRVHVDLSLKEVEDLWNRVPEHKRKAEGSDHAS